MQERNELRAGYDEVKRVCSQDLTAPAAGDAIFGLADRSLRFLEGEGTYKKLVSRVPGKEYASYKLGAVVARPANVRLLERDATKLANLWEQWTNGRLSPRGSARLFYTVALAPCLAMELFDRQNKKGPATYFENLVGHIFARALGQNPRRQATLLVEGEQVKLTMDFLFDPQRKRAGIHLPVKMSTRERVVQAWAHQRLLDGAYGERHYRGVMVLFSETKLDSRSLEVIEICVPNQWLAYQALLAKLETIYYFDIPDRYKQLTTKHGDLIQIREFGEYVSRATKAGGRVCLRV